MKFSFPVRLRHWFIISRWQKWLFPLVCCIPYVAILCWLLMRGALLGCSGAFGASSYGSRARRSHSLVGPPRIQNSVAWS